MAVRKGAALGAAFVRTAQGHASRRTGKMASSTQITEMRVASDRVTVHVECGVDYGAYQDQGTGIYGPEGRPIRPRRARVLRFDWPAAGGVVFAHEVRGSEPTRWWQKTVGQWGQIVRTVSAI